MTLIEERIEDFKKFVKKQIEINGDVEFWNAFLNSEIKRIMSLNALYYEESSFSKTENDFSKL